MGSNSVPGIPDRPGLRPHLWSRFIAGHGLFILSERQADVLVGDIFQALEPLLTGVRSVDEILDSLGAQFGAAQVLYALTLLERAGCLSDGPQAPDDESVFWNAMGGGPPIGDLEIIVRSSVNQEAIRTTCGIRASDGKSSGRRLRLIVVDDYLDGGLAAENYEALSSGQPWMLAKLRGNVLWIGPIFVPGTTACWECLADRLRLNRRVSTLLERHGGEAVRPPLGSASPGMALGCGVIGIEAARWLANNAELGKLRTYDTVTATLEAHSVVRRPQCPVCGDGNNRPRRVQIMEPTGKSLSNDCGLRQRSARATYAGLEHHISSVTGVIGNLRSIDTGNDAINVYIAGHNLATMCGSAALRSMSVRNYSSGKGITDIQAKTSALCESIERYATVYQGGEGYVVASLTDLGASAIHPNACALFSARQLENHARTNERAEGFARVPVPLRGNDRLWWSEVASLVDGRVKYLPTAHIYYHSDALSDLVGRSTCVADSNGTAAGGTVEEAVLQGLLELIERDSVALWWYPRARLPRVDLVSFRSTYLDACLDYHASLGRDLWVLDATTDLDIPAFVAVSRRQHTDERIVMGFGAHVDARVGVERAVAENHQLLGAADLRAARVNGVLDDVAGRWSSYATVAREPYLWPADGKVKTADDYQSGWTGVNAALSECIRAVVAHGCEPFAIDLTRRDVELCVARVVCPGLRHFWPRFGDGRLYEVPLRMGRIPSPLTEDDLNPIPMFL